MEIKTQRGSLKPSNKDIYNIIWYNEDHNDSGYVETVERRSRNVAKFSDKLIDLLYKKGLLNDSDIKELVEPFLEYSEEILEIIKKEDK